MDAYLNYFDLLNIALILGSSILGVLRGFFRELFSFLAWTGALWSSWIYYPAMTLYLTPYVADTFVVPASVSALFFIFLSVFTVVARLLEFIFSFIGLGLLNRPLGLSFGALRGIVMVFVLLALLMASPLEKENWLVKSQTYSWLSPSAKKTLNSITRGRFSRIPGEFFPTSRSSHFS